MTAPAFTLPTEAEELAALETAIGESLQQPMGDAEIDALASEYLRQLAVGDADDERHIAAFKLEIEAMRQRYEKIRAPWAARRPMLENAIKSLTDRATFPGKAKSRTVGHGRFGKRTKPERVAVVDELAAVAALNAAGFEVAIREKRTFSVDMKLATPIVLTRLKADGDILDGFEHIPESQTYVIEPTPLV